MQLRECLGFQGWREVQWVAAAGMVLTAVPCAVLLRDTPEAVGLLPDGVARTESVGDDPAAQKGNAYETEEESEHELLLVSRDSNGSDGSERGAKPAGASTDVREPQEFTLGEALRTRAMWLSMLWILDSGTAGATLIFLVEIVRENGLDRSLEVSLVILMPMTIAEACMTVVAGLLVDRQVAPRLLLVLSSTAAAAASLLLTQVGDHTTGVAFGLLFGLAQGLRQLVTRTLLADLFGRAHHGAIQGTGMVTGVLSTATYPLAFSILRESWGGYIEVLWLCAGVSLGLALLIATCFNRPRK